MVKSIACASVAALLLCVVSFVPAAPVDAGKEQPPKHELPKPDANGRVEIFNGKDLTGWWGDTTLFKVENGEIVGRSEKGLKRNEFLKSAFEVSDFRLVVQMKVVPNKENSGIQFRSQPFKGHEMKGYQADAGNGWWGKLYEESARGMLVKSENDKHVNKDDWNTYEIVAVGNRIMTAINGHQCVDFEDPKGDKSGVFGLQLHSGGPMEVRWKDFRFEVNPKAELVTLKK